MHGQQRAARKHRFIERVGLRAELLQRLQPEADAAIGPHQQQVAVLAAVVEPLVEVTAGAGQAGRRRVAPGGQQLARVLRLRNQPGIDRDVVDVVVDLVHLLARDGHQAVGDRCAQAALEAGQLPDPHQPERQHRDQQHAQQQRRTDPPGRPGRFDAGDGAHRRAPAVSAGPAERRAAPAVSTRVITTLRPSSASPCRMADRPQPADRRGSGEIKGSVSRTVVPTPGVDSTWICPPSAKVTRLRTMYSPGSLRPPPKRVEKKGSNTRPSTPGGMPAPWSCTVMISWSVPSGRTRIWTSPPASR
mmetsp:Transcript_70441/g.165908  ORF Transcript_70441/g.165908 Transcript_70441/m.165908 type:complete len:303 (+) Transcript_70441:2276-3184(+)